MGSEIKPNKIVCCNKCLHEGKWKNFEVVAKIGGDEYASIKCPECGVTGQVDDETFQIEL